MAAHRSAIGKFLGNYGKGIGGGLQIAANLIGDLRQQKSLGEALLGAGASGLQLGADIADASKAKEKAKLVAAALATGNINDLLKAGAAPDMVLKVKDQNFKVDKWADEKEQHKTDKEHADDLFEIKRSDKRDFFDAQQLTEKQKAERDAAFKERSLSFKKSQAAEKKKEAEAADAKKSEEVKKKEEELLIRTIMKKFNFETPQEAAAFIKNPEIINQLQTGRSFKPGFYSPLKWFPKKINIKKGTAL